MKPSIAIVSVLVAQAFASTNEHADTIVTKAKPFPSDCRAIYEDDVIRATIRASDFSKATSMKLEYAIDAAIPTTNETGTPALGGVLNARVIFAGEEVMLVSQTIVRDGKEVAFKYGPSIEGVSEAKFFVDLDGLATGTVDGKAVAPFREGKSSFAQAGFADGTPIKMTIPPKLEQSMSSAQEKIKSEVDQCFQHLDTEIPQLLGDRCSDCWGRFFAWIGGSAITCLLWCNLILVCWAGCGGVFGAAGLINLGICLWGCR